MSVFKKVLEKMALSQSSKTTAIKLSKLSFLSSNIELSKKIDEVIPLIQDYAFKAPKANANPIVIWKKSTSKPCVDLVKYCEGRIDTQEAQVGKT